MRNENGVGQGRLRFTPAFTKAPRGWQRAPGRCVHHQNFNVSVRGPFLSEKIVLSQELWKTRNFAGISCLQSHSGHRAVVHRSRSEICRARLRLSFVPKQHTVETGALMDPGRVVLFLQQGYGSDITHYLHSRRHHHNRAVTGSWLASLHDGKRSTS
jgi:hypothetical protein